MYFWTMLNKPTQYMVWLYNGFVISNNQLI